MAVKRTRLDRFISARLLINRRLIKPMLAQNRVLVNGEIAFDVQQLVDEFSNVVVDGRALSNQTPTYIMLHKPVGVVSATKDHKHKTVIDLLDRPDRADFHIVGRLDLNTSGLVLLTNDGLWSRHLTSPDSQIEKRYFVTVEKPLTDEYAPAFYEGFYFAFEDLTTRPAQIEIRSEFEAEVVLTEGKYHQVKRMFGRFQNRVIKLHRHAIGNLFLDPNLQPGESRELTLAEYQSTLKPFQRLVNE